MPPAPPVVAIANQKGGVGKTTVTLLLADALAHQHKRVLIVDLDPQTNATDHLSLDDFDASSSRTLYDAWDSELEGGATETIVPTIWDGIDLVPGDVSLAKFNTRRELGAEQRLRVVLAGVEDYDVILIDCPAATGPLTDAALVASLGVLAVAEPSTDGLNGVALLRDTAATVRKYYHSGLRDLGVILNRVSNYREDQIRTRQITDSLGDALWHPTIPQRVCIHRIRERGVSIFDVAAGDAQAANVADIAGVLAQRLTKEIQQ